LKMSLKIPIFENIHLITQILDFKNLNNLAQFCI